MSEEGKLLHQEQSSTAASIGNPLYGESGPMLYRVTVASGFGMKPVDVEAKTGDEAAELALRDHPGCKVAHVTPAPQRPKLTAKAA